MGRSGILLWHWNALGSLHAAECFFFSSRRRHTRWNCDWSSDVCSSDLSLWRYGARKELVRIASWLDEHGPRAVLQLTPDGDFSRTGVDWNRQGYALAAYHSQDRKSTRLNSSHSSISYAVFCLKKKKRTP